MTREEYKRLLQSDYWKGYSYSLIKERNYTCEDCGRRFYNERNKLQVHHLVYRDINPWSYSPDEVVVLCEECHRRRHGIITRQSKIFSSTFASPFTVSTDNLYSSAFDNKTIRSNNNINTNLHYPIEPRNTFNYKFIICCLVACFVLFFGANSLYNHILNNETRKKRVVSPVEELSSSTTKSHNKTIKESVYFFLRKQLSPSIKTNQMMKLIIPIFQQSRINQSQQYHRLPNKRL